MQTHWDLLVVGAGPAGSTAALAALRREPGLRVLLLDRDDFPRDKACGDGIAPHVVDVLGPLGAGDVVEGWTPLHRLQLAHGRSRVERRLARPVWVIPRTSFDARLVERAVDAGARMLRHRVRRVRRGDGCVEVDGFTADVVVGADGAHSAVHAAVGEGRPGPRALAIRGYAPTPSSGRGRQVIRFGDRAQPSYAWAFDRGDGLSNVGYGEATWPGAGLTRDLLLEQLERLLPGAAAAGTGWRAHHLPLSGRGWGDVQPDGRVLLAGDAARLINPMTGEGIYYAVATGAIAGVTAVDTLRSGRPDRAGSQHRAAVRRLLNRHLHHTWLAGHLVRRPAMVHAGIRAAAGDQRTFDALVELGLGDGRISPALAGRLGRQLVAHALPHRQVSDADVDG